MPLIRLFIDICLLRAAPQDVPVAPVLLWLTLGTYLVTGLLALGPGEGLVRAGSMVAVDTVTLLVLLAASLRLRGHPARFGQAATALLGTGTLFGVLLLPVLMLGGTGETTANLAFPLWLGLFLWGLVVTAHILRHALDLPIAGGMLVAVLYFAVSMTLIEALFPRPPA